MAKVRPNAVAPEPATSFSSGAVSSPAEDEQPTVLTVWRKSLLFNCDGFTVFDARGDLAFRVDCYGSGRRAEVVLMDKAGKPLLTVRRKRLISLAEHWVIYDGDGDSVKAKPLLSVRRWRTSRRSPPAPRRTWWRAPTADGPARCATRGARRWRRCGGRSRWGTTCSAWWLTLAWARRWPWASSSPSTRCSPAAAARRGPCLRRH